MNTTDAFLVRVIAGPTVLDIYKHKWKWKSKKDFRINVGNTEISTAASMHKLKFSFCIREMPK